MDYVKEICVQQIQEFVCHKDHEETIKPLETHFSCPLCVSLIKDGVFRGANRLLVFFASLRLCVRLFRFRFRHCSTRSISMKYLCSVAFCEGYLR